MTLLKLFFIFFVVKCVEYVMSAGGFNPMLTYMVRFHKLRFFPNLTGNYTITQYKEKQYITGYLNFNRPDPIDKVVILFNRCNPEGVDCEYFQSWALSDLCVKIKDQNQIWSSLYGKNRVEPPIACPINKMVYKLNSTLDVDQIVKWYSDAVNYHWKVTQKMYSGDTHIGSYMMEISIFGYRKRRTQPKN